MVIEEGLDGPFEERRVCPDDDKEYSFTELIAAYGEEYAAKDLEAYWRDAMRPLLADVYIKTCPCPFLVGTTVRLRRAAASGVPAGARAVLRDPYRGRRQVLVALEAAGSSSGAELLVAPGDLEAYQWAATHGAAAAAWARGGEAPGGGSAPSRPPAAARARLRGRAAEEMVGAFPGQKLQVCDLGCGARGADAAAFAEATGASILGLDLRDDAAEVLDWPARGRVSVVPSFDVLRLCDLGATEALGWRRRFHLLWAFDSLQYLTQAELLELLPALRFAARPGGLLALTLPLEREGSGPAAGGAEAWEGCFSQRYSLPGLRELLELSGWSPLEISEAGNATWAFALARVDSGLPVPRGPALEAILHFHRRVSHERPGKMADTGGDKDYGSMPDLFARFPGTQVIELPRADEGGAGWLAQLLGLGLGLTGWRAAEGGDLFCCLRANPSSGGRQPLEAYVIGDRCAVQGWTGSGALFHYHPFWHALEVLYELPADLWAELRRQLPEGAVLIGLTAFFWRTVWKYVEVSFNAVQRDTGHAIASLAYAALAAGARVSVLESATDAALAGLLGLRSFEEEPGGQQPQALLVAAPGSADPWRQGFRLPEALLPIAWQNTAACPGPVPPSNVDALRASRKLRPAFEDAEALRRGPAAAPSSSSGAGGEAIRRALARRRSALAFHGEAVLERGALLSTLAMTRPSAEPLASLLPFASPLVPVLLILVHRVRGLDQGLYALVRDPGGPARWRPALDSRFLWERVSAGGQEEPSAPCPWLFLLRRGDYRKLARQAALGQPGAEEAACCVVILAEWAGALEQFGAWIYRRLLWEAGVVGQALYMGAEVAGAAGCGLGAFFADWTHEALGINGEQLQAVYLFALGAPLDDGPEGSRMPGREAYWHLEHWRGCRGRDAVDTRLAQWGKFPES